MASDQTTSKFLEQLTWEIEHLRTLEISLRARLEQVCELLHEAQLKVESLTPTRLLAMPMLASEYLRTLEISLRASLEQVCELLHETQLKVESLTSTRLLAMSLLARIEENEEASQLP